MEEAVTGWVHSIESFGAVDGPGIRYVLFVQGCPLQCLFCHNPDSWDRTKGKQMTSEEVARDISTYYNYIRQGGVTISGGEPLMQPEFVLDILKRCAAMGLHTALDTAGSMPLSISAPLIDQADMLLLDIKALDPDLFKKLTGRSGQNTLETLDYCRKTGKEVWIRHVLVPGYTLDWKRLEDLAGYLKNYPCVKKVELLPFHKMGEFKWEELHKQYQLYDTPEPTPEEVKRAEQIFRSCGLPL